MLLVALTALAGSAPGAAAAGDPSQPGAYCPFPKAGEKPVCFGEVEEEYADFFEAVDSGRVDDPRVSEVEQALAAPRGEAERTLALSSLAYGYFMLAERAATQEHPDPLLVARLESWNDLLSRAYSDAAAPPTFRTAVREAALDLHARAPAVRASGEECAEAGDADSCETTSQLLVALRRIDDVDADSGVRGALGRLLGRILEDDAPAAEPDPEPDTSRP